MMFLPHPLLSSWIQYQIIYGRLFNSGAATFYLNTLFNLIKVTGTFNDGEKEDLGNTNQSVQH